MCVVRRTLDLVFSTDIADDPDIHLKFTALLFNSHWGKKLRGQPKRVWVRTALCKRSQKLTRPSQPTLKPTLSNTFMEDSSHNARHRLCIIRTSFMKESSINLRYQRPISAIMHSCWQRKPKQWNRNGSGSGAASALDRTRWLTQRTTFVKARESSLPSAFNVMIADVSIERYFVHLLASG